MGSIEKIHEMLVSKECSCTELTKSYLDEIEKADGELNAYVNVTGEEALKTAEAVDRKIASGEKIGMLEGVPMTLKDNISTKGIEKPVVQKFSQAISRFITQPFGKLLQAKTQLCSARRIWTSSQWALHAKHHTLAVQ